MPSRGISVRRVKVHDWDRRAARFPRGGASRQRHLARHEGCRRRSTWTCRGSIDRCVVADIVYVPLVTPLLAAAAARGLATVDGLGMFLHQAVPGFEKWFGVRPEVTDELRALVVADIEGR